MLSGVALLALAELARWGVRETGRIPSRLGAWLLARAAPLIVTMPASGGWLVAAVGGLALRAAWVNGRPRRSTSEAALSSMPASEPIEDGAIGALSRGRQ